jgi:ribokinase
MRRKVIAFIGDLSWDTTLHVDHLPGMDEKVFTRDWVEDVGGVITNAAVACANAGAEVLLFSTVGDDLVAKFAKNMLAEKKIDSILENTGGVTTRVFIIIDSSGEKRLVLIPGENMYPKLLDLKIETVETFSWVHTALYDFESSIQIIAKCRELKIPWSIDLEPATIPRHILDLGPYLKGCQTVIINSQAVKLLGENHRQRLFALGVREVIETRGEFGAVLYQQEKPELKVIPNQSLEPVLDTTGAGDAFAGWFVAQRVLGKSLIVSLELAVLAASLSVRALGGNASYPSISSVEKELKIHEARKRK